jgi:hypothetical protein
MVSEIVLQVTLYGGFQKCFDQLYAGRNVKDSILKGLKGFVVPPNSRCDTSAGTFFNLPHEINLIYCNTLNMKLNNCRFMCQDS